MKKSDTRELLLITKATTHWQGEFDKNVDELMDLVNRVDNTGHVQQSIEVLDVYQHALPDGPGNTQRSKRRVGKEHRPFEFIAFRN